MRRMVSIFLALLFLTVLSPAWAKDDRDTPPNTNTGGGPPPQSPGPSNEDSSTPQYGIEKDSGLFLGGDTGIFVPLGRSSNVLSPQFLSDISFGYILKRRLSFQLRLLTGYGEMERSSASTFLFMTEFDIKYNFLKRGFSPFVMGGVGMYVLSFGGFDPFISEGANLTFVGGGGFDYLFGSNSVGLNVNYRGFSNSAQYFQGMEILVGYSYRFF